MKLPEVELTHVRVGTRASSLQIQKIPIFKFDRPHLAQRVSKAVRYHPKRSQRHDQKNSRLFLIVYNAVEVSISDQREREKQMSIEKPRPVSFLCGSLFGLALQPFEL